MSSWANLRNRRQFSRTISVLPSTQYVGQKPYYLRQATECKGPKLYEIRNVQVNEKKSKKFNDDQEELEPFISMGGFFEPLSSWYGKREIAL